MGSFGCRLAAFGPPCNAKEERRKKEKKVDTLLNRLISFLLNGSRVPQKYAHEYSRWELKMAKIILIVIFVVIVATFSTLNQQQISLRYLFAWETAPFPFFLLILASLVLGIILGFLVGFGDRWRLRTQAHDLGKRVDSLRKEIETLSKKTEPPEPPLSPAEAEKTPSA
jgi:uncharacterized integral membrane protein